MEKRARVGVFAVIQSELELGDVIDGRRKKIVKHK
jgi:hypothetical protein